MVKKGDIYRGDNMKVKPILAKLAEYDIMLTKQEIYVLGYRYGFVTKEEGSHRCTFHEDKFFEFIKNYKNGTLEEFAPFEVPANYVCIEQLAEIYPDISHTKLNYVIKKCKNILKQYCQGRRKQWVDKDEFKEVLDKYHASRWCGYDWNIDLEKSILGDLTNQK